MMESESLAFEQWLNIFQVFSTFALSAVALTMPFLIERMRGNKKVLMLTRELRAINDITSKLSKNFDPTSGSKEKIDEINKKTGQNLNFQAVAYELFCTWRDGLSLDMWERFRYEIRPESYMSLLKQYKILDDIIKSKTSNKPAALKEVMDKDLLDCFNQEHAKHL
jgi:hypothetical protein